MSGRVNTRARKLVQSDTDHAIGYDAFRSKQTPFPFIRDITVDAIAAFGDKLWKELVGTDVSRSTSMKITNVQLSFSGIESMETGQRRIEGFFQKPRSSSRDGTPPIHTTASTSGSGDPSTTLKRKRFGSPSTTATDDGVAKVDAQNGSAVATATAPGFMCDRCNKRVSLSTDVLGNHPGSAAAAFADDDMRERLDRLRREHEDFHFAEDLVRQGFDHDQGTVRSVIRPSESNSHATKKRRQDSKTKGKGAKEAKGNIASFFTQR